MYTFRHINFEGGVISPPSEIEVDFNGAIFSSPGSMRRLVIPLIRIIEDELPGKRGGYTGLELTQVISEFVNYMHSEIIDDGSDRCSAIDKIDNLCTCIDGYVYEFGSMGFSVFEKPITSPGPFLSVLALVQIDKLVVAYCERNLQKIWNLHSDISDLLGHLDTSNEIYHARDATSRQASRASRARHSENYSMRDDALNYYRLHASEWRSINKAAEAIAGNIVPVAFTTVRDWIRAAKKSGEV